MIRYLVFVGLVLGITHSAHAEEKATSFSCGVLVKEGACHDDDNPSVEHRCIMLGKEALIYNEKTTSNENLSKLAESFEMTQQLSKAGRETSTCVIFGKDREIKAVTTNLLWDA